MRWLLPIPGLTNFYLREEDLELRHAFWLPPSIRDGFETAEGAALNRQSELLMATTGLNLRPGGAKAADRGLVVPARRPLIDTVRKLTRIEGVVGAFEKNHE
jgi:hypothetical protein